MRAVRASPWAGKQFISLHTCPKELRTVALSAGCALAATSADYADADNNRGAQRANVSSFSRLLAKEIGIVQYDDPAMTMWRAFAKKHGHVHLLLSPTLRPYHGPAKYRMFAVDWWAFEALVVMLHDPTLTALTHFLYTEADQWPVQPLRPLQDLFGAASESADQATAMVVAEELPCRDNRGGGLFN